MSSPLESQTETRPSLFSLDSKRKYIICITVIIMAGLAFRIGFVASYEFNGFHQYGTHCLGKDNYPGCNRFFRHEVKTGIGGDALYYHDQAHLLLEGKMFVLPSAYYETGAIKPSASHPPLYTVTLAVEDVLGLKTVDDQRIAGCFLGELSVLLLAVAAGRIAGRRASIVAAIIGSAYPGMWIFDGTDMSEIVSILVISFLIAETYRFIRHPSRKGAIWLGIIIAFASYARSELILLDVLVPIPIAFYLYRNKLLYDTTKKAVGLVAITIASSLITLGPWIGFNLSRFSKPEFLSTQLGMTLAVSNCNEVYSGQFIGFWDLPNCLENRPVTKSVGPPPKKGDESVLDSYWRTVGLHYIRDHISQLPKVILAREGRVFWLFNPGQQENLNAFVEQWNPSADVAFRWSFYVLAIASIFGGVVIKRKYRLPISPLIGPVLVVVVAVFVTYGTTRFQSAAEPTIVILSSIAISRGFDLKSINKT